MSTSRELVIAGARVHAQDKATAPLLADVTDYQVCVTRALQQFNQDKPRLWVFDHTVVTSGFKFVLFGAGTIMTPTGMQAWVDGFSDIKAIYYPYLASTQNDDPVDPNFWRIIEDAGNKVVLEFLGMTPGVGEVFRLFYTTPHTVHVSDVTLTSVRAADVEALNILVGAVICDSAAIRYAQNMGSSNLQADTVDRRTQSDVMKARAKDLRADYNRLVGRSDKDGGVKAASGFKDLDVGTGHRRGSIWHPSGNR